MNKTTIPSPSATSETPVPTFADKLRKQVRANTEALELKEQQDSLVAKSFVDAVKQTILTTEGRSKRLLEGEEIQIILDDYNGGELDSLLGKKQKSTILWNQTLQQIAIEIAKEEGLSISWEYIKRPFEEGYPALLVKLIQE